MMSTRSIEATQPIIRTACSRVTDEIEIIKSERDAHLQFAKRIESVSHSSIGGNKFSRTDVALQFETSVGKRAAQEVCEAFRETVMAVPHYEEEYAESLQAHFAAEFGSTLATRVSNGTFDERTYDALLTAVRTAAEDRRLLLTHLRREHESLHSIKTELNEMERRMHQLRRQFEGTPPSRVKEVRNTLTKYEQTCGSLATDRQQLIHNRGHVSGIAGQSLLQYLYADLETDCPALTEITDTVETIRSCQQEGTPPLGLNQNENQHETHN